MTRRYKITARAANEAKPSISDMPDHWAVVDTETGRDVAFANCAQAAAVAAQEFEKGTGK